MAPSATLPTASISTNSNHGSPSNALSTQGSVAKQMVFDIMSSRVAALDLDTCRLGDGDSFIVADMGDIYRKHMDWKTHLGRVKPHYGSWLRKPFCILLLKHYQP